MTGTRKPQQPQPEMRAADPAASVDTGSAGRRPTDVLEEEHRSILKVVGAMAVMAESLEKGEPIRRETLRDTVDFMRNFADKCHHGKEETHLFPALARSGVPMQGCPVGALVHEHEMGRGRVAHLAEAVDAYLENRAGSSEAVVEALRGLIGLYPNHIWKEDYLLFPMTNKVLGPEEQAHLAQEFDRVEEAIGRDMHRRFELFAEEIGQRARSIPPNA